MSIITESMTRTVKRSECFIFNFLSISFFLPKKLANNDLYPNAANQPFIFPEQDLFSPCD